MRGTEVSSGRRDGRDLTALGRVAGCGLWIDGGTNSEGEHGELDSPTVGTPAPLR